MGREKAGGRDWDGGRGYWISDEILKAYTMRIICILYMDIIIRALLITRISKHMSYCISCSDLLYLLLWFTVELLYLLLSFTVKNTGSYNVCIYFGLWSVCWGPEGIIKGKGLFRWYQETYIVIDNIDILTELYLWFVWFVFEQATSLSTVNLL